MTSNDPAAGRSAPDVARRGGAVRAAVTLARPVNCALAALSVWVGAVTTGMATVPSRPVWLAALAAAAITGAGNGLNDVLDLAVDRRNRPQRPLPSGRLAPAAALAQSALLGAGGLALAWIVGPLTGAIALAVSAGLAAYNWSLKGSGLPGNALVSLLAAATFPFGAVAAGGGGRWWIPATFALLYHGGRELVKGAEDVEGDAVAGVRTLARTRGPGVAARAGAALFAVVAVTAPLPALVGIYRWAYLVPVLALDALLAVAVTRLWRCPPAAGTASTSRRLLLGMALGLLAVVLGEWIDRA